MALLPTVTWQTTACRLRAEELAKSLGLPLASHEGHEPAGTSSVYTLHISEERLELILRKKSEKSVLFAEFVTGSLGYRRRHGGGRNQAIAKAVGIKNSRTKITVLDVTAGLGRDGFILASLGCQVHLIERSPLLAALLCDGLERAKQNPELCSTIQAIQVTIADGKNVLQSLSEENRPDVVYLDPMFPTQTKGSALEKIEMRIIREIVGDDLDSERLLPLALDKAKKRVVVKRPRRAPLLAADRRSPSFTIEGRSSRYDVYLMGGTNHAL